MLRIKELSVLIVMLSGLLLYSCVNDNNQRNREVIDTNIVQDTLPIYVFESEEMAKADSLFWTYDLEAAKEIYTRIDITELENLERSIYNCRMAFWTAEFKNTTQTDSLLDLLTIDSSIVKSYWNISLGQDLVIGLNSYLKRENEKSRIHLEKAFGTNETRQIKNLYWAAFITHRIGKVYFYRLKDAFAAKDWFEKEEELRSYLFDQDEDHYMLYSKLAPCLRNIGDYEGALSYCLLSEEYLRKRTNPHPRLEPLLFGEYGNNYLYLDDTVNFIKYYDKSVKLLAQRPELKSLRIRLTNNFARLCLDIGLVDKANSIYEELDNLLNPNDTISQIRHLELRANLAKLKSNKKEAIQYQNYALDLHQNYTNYDSLMQSILLTNLGFIFQSFDEHELAIASFEKSLTSLFGEQVDFVNYMESLAGKNYLLHGGFKFELSPIAYSLQNLEKSEKVNSSNLESAQKYYDFLKVIFDDISKQRSEGVVLRDLETFKKIFGEAIACAFKQRSIDDSEIQSARIFDFMERGKAALLYNSIRTRTLGKQLRIPEILLTDLEQLNEEKIQLEEKLIRADVDNQQRINRELLSNDNLLVELKNKINQENPRFFQNLSVNEIFEFEDVVKWAKRHDKGIIQYHWSDIGLFGLSVFPSGKIMVKNIGRQDVLGKEIKALLEFLHENPSPEASGFEKFNRLVRSLGDKLLRGLLPEDGLSNDLILIPDGLLSALPFELLSITDKASMNFSDINYLLKSFNVSYAYSASTLLHSYEDKTRNENKSIGLFSFSDNNNLCEMDDSLRQPEFHELPGSSIEIDAIADLFSKGKRVWKGAEATKDNFNQHAKEQKILHLALHAEASSEDRFFNKIIFRTPNCSVVDPLYSYELNAMNLNTELVFLSACETGRGVSRPGEGVYSIARGFMNAGVPSIIMSLWRLEDKVTLSIKLSFYQNLKNGLSIDESLRKAKLDYLENADEFFAHPYFWAPLVTIGKTSPLFESSFF